MLAVTVLCAMGVGDRARPGGVVLPRWKPTNPLVGGLDPALAEPNSRTSQVEIVF